MVVVCEASTCLRPCASPHARWPPARFTVSEQAYSGSWGAVERRKCPVLKVLTAAAPPPRRRPPAHPRVRCRSPHQRCAASPGAPRSRQQGKLRPAVPADLTSGSDQTGGLRRCVGALPAVAALMRRGTPLQGPLPHRLSAVPPALCSARRFTQLTGRCTAAPRRTTAPPPA